MFYISTEVSKCLICSLQKCDWQGFFLNSCPKYSNLMEISCFTGYLPISLKNTQKPTRHNRRLNFYFPKIFPI